MELQLGAGAKKIPRQEILSLYFIYGNEKYMVKKCAKKLIKKFYPKEFPEFNLHEFSDDSTADEIADAAETIPFMAQRRLIVINDFNIETKSASQVSKMKELLESIPEASTLIFYYPTLQIDEKSSRWKAFLKNIKKAGEVILFDLLDTSRLREILVQAAEKRGCKITKRNAEKIIEYSGRSVKGLLNEVEKLTAFAGSGEIDSAMIEKMVSKNMETTAFVLAKMLLSGDYEQAYKQMDILFYNGAQPVAIIAALSMAYVDLYRVNAALQSGGQAISVGEYISYKGREFRIRNAVRNLRGTDTQTLRQSLYILLETDHALKNARTAPRVIMDTMIARLLLAARGESRK